MSEAGLEFQTVEMTLHGKGVSGESRKTSFTEMLNADGADISNIKIN